MYIESVRESGGRVLVHCLAGISRSATICMAYLMRARGLTLDEAHDYLKQRRPLISPNLNFLRQLAEFEVALDASLAARRKSKQNSIIGASSLSFSSLCSSVSGSVLQTIECMNSVVNDVRELSAFSVPCDISLATDTASREVVNSEAEPAGVRSLAALAGLRSCFPASLVYESLVTESSVSEPQSTNLVNTFPTTLQLLPPITPTTTTASLFKQQIGQSNAAASNSSTSSQVSDADIVRYGLKNNGGNLSAAAGMSGFGLDAQDSLSSSRKRRHLVMTSDLLGPVVRPRAGSSSVSSMIPTKHACFTFDFPSVVSALAASSPTVCHSPLLSPS